MKQRAVAADVRKNKSDPSLRPIVAGPTASASTLTKEKAPLMIPNPNPATYARICLLLVICSELSVTFFRPLSAFLRSLYIRNLKTSCRSTENTRPNASLLRKGITMNHKSDDIKNDSSQKKALAIRIIILIGSLAIVKANIARGGPNARNVQPKNSIIEIGRAHV